MPRLRARGRVDQGRIRGRARQFARRDVPGVVVRGRESRRGRLRRGQDDLGGARPEGRGHGRFHVEGRLRRRAPRRGGEVRGPDRRGGGRRRRGRDRDEGGDLRPDPGRGTRPGRRQDDRVRPAELLVEGGAPPCDIHLLQGQVGAAADHEMRAQRFLRHKRHDEAVGELQSPVRGSGLFRLRPVLRKVRVRLLQPLPRDSGLGQLLHVEARPVQLDNVPPVRRCQGQVLPAAREAALRRREGEGRGENRPPAGVLRGVRRAAVDRRRPPGAERQDGPGLDPRGVSMRDRGRTI
mmetsp:Transcript_31060/g.74064  ORF Transcript_31060/g.74064 Transcript_31060/m.74064 type:complete len:294 (-) Transcript_31060:176-1057(-)